MMWSADYPTRFQSIGFGWPQNAFKIFLKCLALSGPPCGDKKRCRSKSEGGGSVIGCRCTDATTQSLDAEECPLLA
jgi:hypothetical protein